MQIELDDWENGQPTVVKTSKQVAQKVKFLKQTNNYGEIYQITQSMPNNRTKYLVEANALMHLRKWKDLAECCQRGLDVQECHELYNLKGKAMGKLGNYQAKLQLTLKAVQINPKLPAYHRNVGAAHYKLADYPAAIRCHEAAIRLQPRNSINYHNKGAALFRMKQYEAAKECLRQAITLDHKQTISHSWLGDCEKELGNLREAREHYKTAYELSNNDTYKKQIEAIEERLNPNAKKGIRGFFSKLLN